MNQLKKIVILGPESTGKSTLCAALATHFNTTWCPEYARQFLNENGTDYSYDDLLTIAKGQLAGEDAFVEKANNLLIIDTDMYVMKVWCEYVFGKCHQFILDEIIARKYDLYLLCNIDLPWTKDELREYPDEGPRKELFHIYQDILINQSVPWALISGEDEARFASAKAAIDHFIFSK